MDSTLVVTSAPHIRTKDSITRIMLDVILALIPAGIVSVFVFGWRVLLVIAVSVLSAVVTEAVMQKIMKKPITIKDLSAVVTGLLLAYNLPPTIPLWIAMVGSMIAIALVKQIFGGLGQNFMNPALGARAILVASWPSEMTHWIGPGTSAAQAVAEATSSASVDASAMVTPLALLKNGAISPDDLPSVWYMLTGNIGGTIGEISAIALLIGAAYLFIRKVINWRIPVSFIGTVALLTWIFGPSGLFTGLWFYHIAAGGLILGAFFMANDYATAPVTPLGQIVAGILCGLVTSIIRLAGGYPGGVSYSILIMNIATPLIDKYTRPKVIKEVR